MKTRNAVSLVELLVVMSACSVILTMSASLLHRAMRVESQSRAFANSERSALRLARQFRQDVHQATKASIGKGDTLEKFVLRLQFEDQSAAEYIHSGAVVMRVLTQGDGSVSREEFAFPSPVTLDVQQEDSLPRIVLTMTAEKSAAATVRSKPVELHVEASLNRAGSPGELP